MLGHRGCRLAVTYPELYEMQVEAIIESVIKLQKGRNVPTRNYDSSSVNSRRIYNFKRTIS